MSARLLLVAAVLILSTSLGCGSSHRPERDGSTPAGDAGPRVDTGPGVDAGPGTTECGGFAGLPCAADEWCDFPDGSFCGGDDSTGICRPRPDGCDLVYDPVCGCDGMTHGNACGANMAGTDVQSVGECGGATECTNAMPCTGGSICSGSSCASTWTCVFSAMPCTDDAAPYCGCDGTTFYDSSTCPLQPFAHRGECGTVISCDRRNALCPALPPDCPTGQVPSVEGGCWGECVDIGACTCETSEECADPLIYVCYRSGRCGPPL